MDLLWMVLPVFLVCSAAQNLTEIKAQLGEDIILNCLIDNPSILWYMEIHSRFRGCIARVINDGSSNQYYVSTSISKYEAINKKRLVIKNITAEDCRLYFCARRLDSKINFEYAFHVVSDVFIPPSTNDSQANRQQQQHICRICQNELVIYSSLVLNALLIIIGLVFTSLCLKRKKCSYLVNDPSPLPCETPETQETAQYEEIQLSSCTSVPAGPPSECIYYRAQRPKSMLPQH